MADGSDFHAKVGTEVKRQSHSRRQTPAKPAPDGSVASGVSTAKEDAPKQQGSIGKWACAKGDTFFGVPEPQDRLAAGFYVASYADGIGPVAVKKPISIDTLMRLPDDAMNDVLNEFELFWTLGEAFKQRGFLHKRGFLFHGPPGSGKTSMVHLLTNELVRQQNGIVLQIGAPSTAAGVVQMIRKVEPDRPMICIMEDFDTLVERYGEDDYLSLLDGEAQVDKVVFVATTNYPERLDARFVDRPSRFDTIKYIGMPSDAARRMYFERKEPELPKEELEQWVKLTDGLSIAHMKEMIIAVKCLGQPVEQVAKRLDAMKHKPKSTDFAGGGVGFVTRRRG